MRVMYLTMNPNRECGVCGLVDSRETRPMNILVAILPDPEPFTEHKGTPRETFEEQLTVAANELLPKLRDACHNCPACIFAAIRQSGIPPWMVSDFDWDAEMKSVLKEANDSQQENLENSQQTIGW